MFDSIFEDSKAGAVDCMNAISTYAMTAEACEATPDPEVRGVWKLVWEGRTFIVYLKGYADPWGETRDHNDFEEVWG